MVQILGPTFGDGSDGHLSVSSDITDSPTKSSAILSSGETELTATNPAFVDSIGKPILLYQSTGTGVGLHEFNTIGSYTAGTITTALPSVNDFLHSGNNRAQVIVPKQYSGITIDSGQTLYSSNYGASGGGIICYMCSGTTTVIGDISTVGRGLRFGNPGGGPDRNNGWTGSGETGVASSESQSPNSTGGGGGDNDRGDGGGGGGHVNAGVVGQQDGGGKGGLQSAFDIADLTRIMLGSGGGGGGNWSAQSGAGRGGSGGGIIYLITRHLVVTGGISVNGENGQPGGTGQNISGGGGAGSAGSILVKAQTVSIGADLLTANGGTGGTGNFNGGAGSIGRIRIESCSITGSTSQGSVSTSEGGYAWCGSLTSII